MSAQPGMQVGPNLRLLHLLQEGGMGSVWVAEHLTLHTHLAVKFLSPELAANPDMLARFSREAAAAAQIKSQYVVQIFDHGVTQEGVPYIAMELLDGEDLGSRMRREGRLELDWVAKLVDQTSRALSKAHEQGIIHRDIKPDNLFLTAPDGDLVVKVLDFGIAKHIDAEGPRTTAAGRTVGTPLYMSPEQIMDNTVTIQADLWALAVVVYECLTGQVPFPGETFGAIALRVHHREFARATELSPKLPKALDVWFAKAFANDPSRRFASAREMARELSSIATEADAIAPGRLETTAVRVMGDVQGSGLSRRSRRSLIAACAIVGFGGALVALAFSLGVPSNAAGPSLPATQAPVASVSAVVDETTPRQPVEQVGSTEPNAVTTATADVQGSVSADSLDAGAPNTTQPTVAKPVHPASTAIGVKGTVKSHHDSDLERKRLEERGF